VPVSQTASDRRIEGARINAVGAFNGRDVHKDVLAAALELDGSIALVRIER
jgi:hypothetical protein